MPENTLPQKGLVVTSNELIHAKYHFSLWQKRVFLYFVSLIEKEARDFGLQKVYIADLLRFFETEQNGTVMSIIENVPRQLFETSIQVPYRDEEGNERFGEVRLITKYTKPQDKKPGNAYIELKFNEDLKPHLIDLKKHFSKFELRYIVHLQSAYAIRIYEILKSHQFREQIDLDVDFLKSILEVGDKYKLYGDFKRKIIDKAQQEMAANCDISFTYDEIKSGKKVVTLRFRVFENQNWGSERQGRGAAKNASAKTAEAPTPPEKVAGQDALFLELQPVAVGEWGVSPTRLLELLKTHSADQIRQAFRVTRRKAASGSLTNAAGFFIEAIQKGFTDEQEQLLRKKTEQAARQTRQTESAKKLQTEVDELLDELRGEINAVIRSLVEADPQVRSRAIEAVKKTKNPVLKKEFEKLGAAPEEQDFRNNPKLREAVIWEVVSQNDGDFREIGGRFGGRLRAMLASEKFASAGFKPFIRFEVKTFLNLH